MTKRIGLICGLGIVAFCASCDESSQVGFEMSSAYAESQQALSYQPEKIDSSLARYLDVPCGQEMVDISLSFDNKIDVPELEFDFEYREGKSFLNGKEATESELKKLGEELDANQDLKLAAFHDKRIRLSKNVQAKNVYKGNEESFRIFEDGFEALTISVDACVIKSLTDLEELISISETLTVEPATIATAMQATYVTQSMNWTYNHGGQDVGVYLSEPVCPPTSYLNNTNYTILSGTPVSGYTDEHARKTTRVIRDVSPNAHIYCRAGMTAPLQSDLGTAHSPRISVASLSYGSGTSTYSYTDQTLDDLVYGNYVTAVVAAGNTNNCSTTPHVASPGKAVNAITVGNYNDYNIYSLKKQ